MHIDDKVKIARENGYSIHYDDVQEYYWWETYTGEESGETFDNPIDAWVGAYNDAAKE